TPSPSAPRPPPPPPPGPVPPCPPSPFRARPRPENRTRRGPSKGAVALPARSRPRAGCIVARGQGGKASGGGTMFDSILDRLTPEWREIVELAAGLVSWIPAWQARVLGTIWQGADGFWQSGARWASPPLRAALLLAALWLA